MRPFSLVVLASACLLRAGATTLPNSTFTNPMLPGWHSDPSCTFVPDHNNSLFCVTSSFLGFPGLPIYASKDLQNFKLVSSAFNRPSQVPLIAAHSNQRDGLWAPTVRYHNGTFYVIVVDVAVTPTGHSFDGYLFSTTDPYHDAAWSDPVHFLPNTTDPDLFWDDDGTVWMATGGIYIRTIDLLTGELGDAPNKSWHGTGAPDVEGPHIYKRDDGYYYLMIAEGGTGIHHAVVISRSLNVTGPYEGYSHNPIQTNNNTQSYFQDVGHADLFQDASSNWWGIALSVRSGPENNNFPMGRETVLFPVTWKQGEWPVCEPVQGNMTGWHLPVPDTDIQGEGAFLLDDDIVDFEPLSSIPAHFIYWRFPITSNFVVSPPGHPNTLRLTPSNASMTENYALNLADKSLTFVGRRQTHTVFNYSVDVSFQPRFEEEEVGITLMNTRDQHMDLGIVLLPVSSGNATLSPHFRLRFTGTGAYVGPALTTKTTLIQESWINDPIRLIAQAVNQTHYSFSAASVKSPTVIQNLGYGPSALLTGQSGSYTGAVVGVYATTNGGKSGTQSYISRWRYWGLLQCVYDNCQSALLSLKSSK